jgi:hypothetical protein
MNTFMFDREAVASPPLSQTRNAPFLPALKRRGFLARFL